MPNVLRIKRPSLQRNSAAARPCCRFGRLGYTLIELMIVITLLGLSSVLLVPHLVNRDSMNAQAAVRLLIGDLSFAQSDALAHQEVRRVYFYPDGRGYCLLRLEDESQIGTPFDPDTAAPEDYVYDPLVRSSSGGRYIVDFTTDERFRGVTITSVELEGVELSPDGSYLHYDTLGGIVAPGGGPGVGGTIVISSGEESFEITVAPFTGKLTVREL